MTKRETIKYLSDELITRHKGNEKVFDSFVRLMLRYRYGRSETGQAYHFFISGWNEPIRFMESD